MDWQAKLPMAPTDWMQLKFNEFAVLNSADEKIADLLQYIKLT